MNIYSNNQKSAGRAPLPVGCNSSGTCKTHLTEIPLHPRPLCASRRSEISRKLSPPRFAPRENFSATFAPSSLTRAAEGVRARQAKRRRTGAGARTAPIPQAARLGEAKPKGRLIMKNKGMNDRIKEEAAEAEALAIAKHVLGCD